MRRDTLRCTTKQVENMGVNFWSIPSLDFHHPISLRVTKNLGSGLKIFDESFESRVSLKSKNRRNVETDETVEMQ